MATFGIKSVFRVMLYIIGCEDAQIWSLCSATYNSNWLQDGSNGTSTGQLGEWKNVYIIKSELELVHYSI